MNQLILRLIRRLRGTAGPEICEDAKRYCSERTGALKDSIHDDFDEATATLIVEATGSKERE